MSRSILLEMDSPDPTNAINAFLWNMSKARALGFMPKTEHTLAEHLFREDVKLIFYSSANGLISLCGSEDILGDDDAFEILQFVMERRRKSIRHRKAASAVGKFAQAFSVQGIEARSDTTGTGVAEGESPSPTGCAQ